MPYMELGDTFVPCLELELSFSLALNGEVIIEIINNTRGDIEGKTGKRGI